MKLGTETGSLVNHIHSIAVKGQPTPVVGMGCTILGWTDRQAATIVNVSNIRGRTYLVVQEDHAKRVDHNGMSESQTYEFTPNPNGLTAHYQQDAAGRWNEVRYNAETKRFRKTGGPGLRIGARDHYHDFSF